MFYTLQKIERRGRVSCKTMFYTPSLKPRMFYWEVPDSKIIQSVYRTSWSEMSISSVKFFNVFHTVKPPLNHQVEQQTYQFHCWVQPIMSVLGGHSKLNSRLCFLLNHPITVVTIWIKNHYRRWHRNRINSGNFHWQCQYDTLSWWREISSHPFSNTPW